LVAPSGRGALNGAGATLNGFVFSFSMRANLSAYSPAWSLNADSENFLYMTFSQAYFTPLGLESTPHDLKSTPRGLESAPHGLKFTPLGLESKPCEVESAAGVGKSATGVGKSATGVGKFTRPLVKSARPLVKFAINTEKPAKGISQVCFTDYFI
jgi:hypothetical protein